MCKLKKYNIMVIVNIKQSLIIDVQRWWQTWLIVHLIMLIEYGIPHFIPFDLCPAASDCVLCLNADAMRMMEGCRVWGPVTQQMMLSDSAEGNPHTGTCLGIQPHADCSGMACVVSSQCYIHMGVATKFINLETLILFIVSFHSDHIKCI